MWGERQLGLGHGLEKLKKIPRYKTPYHPLLSVFDRRGWVDEVCGNEFTPLSLNHENAKEVRFTPQDVCGLRSPICLAT